MTDIAITVENLSKRYKIGETQAGYKTFRDSFANTIKRFSSRNTGGPEARENTIWALKNVSFEVRAGEVLGIIGRNGAGKSTLLKVLARITRPTAGRVRLCGRVGSLLEVGTGFHPELTGQENIYLNGAILGMKKAEITRRFDEIVNFAEIEKFLDTPVKHYSSGMYMRLAFAVAAHLETEILLVDEVLAVGDAQFQKKCLGKMGQIAQGGRTVLFVSHNIAAIKNLCGSALYLSEGALRYIGDVNTATDTYLNSGSTERIPLYQSVEKPELPVQLLSVSVVNEQGELATQHPYDQPFWLKVGLRVGSPISKIYLAAHIHDHDLNTLIFTRDFESDESHLLLRKPGRYTYSIQIPAPLLVPGTYWLSVHVARSSPAQVIDGADYVCPFDIVDSGSIQAKMGFPWRGKISIPLKWECVQNTPV